jgi:hypothetical protein
LVHRDARREPEPEDSAVTYLYPTVQAAVDAAQNRGRTEGLGSDLASQSAHKVSGSAAHPGEQLANLLKAGAQIRVANLDRQHRILKPRKRAVRACDRLHGTVEKALHAP